MTFHKGRGILFGGVHDVEASEEGMDSEFFNQLFAWNIERNRFMPLGLRKPRQQKRAAPEQPRVGRRGRAQANEEELLKQLAALETGASLDDVDGIEIDKKEEEPEEDEKPAREMPVTMEPPHVRFNAQMAVQDDVLYIYGGTFEKGDREFTFDDLYAIDLSKLDGCKEIFNRPVEDWIVSRHRAVLSVNVFADPGQESEDEDDDEDEDDEEDEEDDDEDEDDELEQLHTPSKRKKQDVVSDTASETTSAPPEEDDTETTATSVDDGLPHPRVSSASILFLFPRADPDPDAMILTRHGSHLSLVASSLYAQPPSGRKS